MEPEIWNIKILFIPSHRIVLSEFLVDPEHWLLPDVNEWGVGFQSGSEGPVPRSAPRSIERRWQHTYTFGHLSRVHYA